ncbi:MAG TPA: FISUMP domain-containing protein [Paludibacter sp.]
MLIVASLVFITCFKSQALNYTINFTGTGASPTVGSVIVQNLTQGTTVTVPTGSSLNLVVSSTAVEQFNADNLGLNILQRGTDGKATLSFVINKPGNTQVAVYSIEGRKIASNNYYLNQGFNSFELTLPCGLFLVQVHGNDFSYSGKIISPLSIVNTPTIKQTGTQPAIQRTKSIINAGTTMAYTIGDQLLYKGISGNYSTIVTDVPTSSKTTNFNFVPCQDADGNNYTVVNIGTQTWMAENLKTTKYRNGESISNFQANADWAPADPFQVVSSAWCDYNNDPANGLKYGKLYNWYAAVDSRNIAPSGWHVASDAEWTTLFDTVYYALPLIRPTITYNQSISAIPLIADTSVVKNGVNAAGFSALPSKTRFQDGSFYLNGNQNLNFGSLYLTTTNSSTSGTSTSGIPSPIIRSFDFFNLTADKGVSISGRIGGAIRCLIGETGSSNATPTFTLSTFAGSNFDTRTGLFTSLPLASFDSPLGVAIDATGNVYVAETYEHKIRKISPEGIVSTLAGSGKSGSTDGMGSAASFNFPYSVAVDAAGTVYVADTENYRIRKISPTGKVTTLAGGKFGNLDGTGTAACFGGTSGIAVDAAGYVYVADQTYNEIRKISPLGVVTTLAGNHSSSSKDGIGTAAGFGTITQIAVTPKGTVYVAEYPKIRKITAAGVVTTLAGSAVIGNADGVGAVASFQEPDGIAVDAAENVYVSDGRSHLIRKITTTAVVTTLAGNGLPGNVDAKGISASFAYPKGLAVDAARNVYVADSNNGKIRMISATAIVTTFAGGGSSNSSDGIAASDSLYNPIAVTVDAAGYVYEADPSRHKIRKISPAGLITNLAGSGLYGSVDGIGGSASFYHPSGVAVDGSGTIYVADAGNNKIRKISPTGVVTTFAGSGNAGSTDGKGTAASFNYPAGIAIDAAGTIYVADAGNCKIRKISSTGEVSTIAGSGDMSSNDGIGIAASFYWPTGVAIDATGTLYVAEDDNKIRKISTAGVVTTLAGNEYPGNKDATGFYASFNKPTGLTVDATGNVYVADSKNHAIRKISPSGEVSTIAGTGVSGSANGLNGTLNNPQGIAISLAGELYIADSGNNKIRKLVSTK